jgi:hypothetical protein
VPPWTESAPIYSCSQREEFDARKKAAEEAKASKLRNAPKKLASADKDLSHFPFLHNLAEREVLFLGKNEREKAEWHGLASKSGLASQDYSCCIGVLLAST